MHYVVKVRKNIPTFVGWECIKQNRYYDWVVVPQTKYALQFANSIGELWCVLHEIGGLNRKTTIVCGTQGTPLYPIKTYQKAATQQADFMVKHGITITVAGHLIEIRKFSIEPPYKKLVWQGPIGALPQKLNYLRNAVDAALSKYQCDHCQHVHYYASSD